LGRCKFCHYEFDESYNPYKSDDWDILNLKEEDGWEHIQILDRLRLKGVDCYQADIWFDNNLAVLIGCLADSRTISRVLNINEEVIYRLDECGNIVLNLYQEKCLRKGENNG
jgi:hypothetical protein